MLNIKMLTIKLTPLLRKEGQGVVDDVRIFDALIKAVGINHP